MFWVGEIYYPRIVARQERACNVHAVLVLPLSKPAIPRWLSARLQGRSMWRRPDTLTSPEGAKWKEFHCGDQYKYHIVMTLFKSVKQFGKEGFSLHLILDHDMQAST